MKNKFKIKPKELNSWRYWAHVSVIALVVLGLLQIFSGGDMFTIKNILWSVPLLAFADIVAHTLMRID